MLLLFFSFSAAIFRYGRLCMLCVRACCFFLSWILTQNMMKTQNEWKIHVDNANTVAFGRDGLKWKNKTTKYEIFAELFSLSSAFSSGFILTIFNGITANSKYTEMLFVFIYMASLHAQICTVESDALAWKSKIQSDWNNISNSHQHWHEKQNTCKIFGIFIHLSGM